MAAISTKLVTPLRAIVIGEDVADSSQTAAMIVPLSLSGNCLVVAWDDHNAMSRKFEMDRSLASPMQWRNDDVAVHADWLFLNRSKTRR